MKRKLVIASCIILVGIIATVLIILNKNEDKPAAADEGETRTQTTVVESSQSVSTAEPTAGTTQESTISLQEAEGDVLTERTADLDGDSQDEIIQIQKKTAEDTEGNIAGTLVIKGINKEVRVPFPQKRSSLTGLFSEIAFQDMDGDGAKDIFILLPDNGAQFNFSYFFMFNYKTGKTFAYQEDAFEAKISEYASSFKFSYQGKGILNFKSDALQVEGKMDLKSSLAFSEEDAVNQNYDKSWVASTPVELDQDSGVKLIAGDNDKIRIKIALPIFGQGTMDILGRVDLNFKVDSGFKLVLSKVEVVQLVGGTKQIAGSKELK